MVQKRARELSRKIIFLQILFAPGAIMLGLGAYAMYGADGAAFIEILNNREAQFALIGLGVILLIIEGFLVIPLAVEKDRLTKKSDT